MTCELLLVPLGLAEPGGPEAAVGAEIAPREGGGGPAPEADAGAGVALEGGSPDGVVLGAVLGAVPGAESEARDPKIGASEVVVSGGAPRPQVPARRPAHHLLLRKMTRQRERSRSKTTI